MIKYCNTCRHHQLSHRCRHQRCRGDHHRGQPQQLQPDSLLPGRAADLCSGEQGSDSLKVFSHREIKSGSIHLSAVFNKNLILVFFQKAMTPLNYRSERKRVLRDYPGDSWQNSTNSFQVKHAQCFDVALMDDGSVVLASKDYRLYIYRYIQVPPLGL